MATWTSKVDYTDKILAADFNALQTLKADIQKKTAANLGVLDEGEFGLETDTRRVLIGSSTGNQVIKGDYITPEMYGAVGDGVTDDTAAIQAAITSGATNTVPVWLFGGTYILKQVGNDPNISGYKYCLNLPSNTTLIINKGATLKLASGQSTDANPVNMITMGNVDNIYIGGEGEINFNTAGQTGWTGGYGQQVGGSLIVQRVTAPHGNITIEDLTLTDCFSTTPDLRGTSAVNFLSDVFLRRLKVSDCGEGIQVQWAKRVTVEDCVVSDPADVMVGDGIEMAGVDGFFLHNNTMRENGGGTGYDIYGSINGIIDGFLIDAWSSAGGGGLDIAHTGTYWANNPYNITVSNGIIKDCPGCGIALKGGYASNISFTNVQVIGCDQYGLQAGQDNIAIPGPIIFSNVVFDGNTGAGAYFKSTRGLIMKACVFSNNTVSGFAYAPRTGCAADEEVGGLLIDSCSAIGNTTYGFQVGDAVNSHHVRINFNNCYNIGNGTNFSLPSDITSRDNIQIRAVGPPMPLNVTNTFAVSEATYVNIVGNLTTLTKGTCGQVLAMRFWGSYTVTHSIVTDGFDLQGATDFVGVAGNTLTVCWMTGQWREIGRKT
jgi:hypothetical protein